MINLTFHEIQNKLNISRFSGAIAIFVDAVRKIVACSTLVPNHTSKARLVCFLLKF